MFTSQPFTAAAASHAIHAARLPGHTGKEILGDPSSRECEELGLQELRHPQALRAGELLAPESHLSLEN